MSQLDGRLEMYLNIQDSTGTYFAVRGQVYCEQGPLVDPCEGESILLGGLEGNVIRRRMGI